MKRFLLSLFVFLFLSGVAIATPISIVERGAEWEFSIFDAPDLYDDWGAANHSTFDWATASWSTGNAAFGNTQNYANSGLYYNTEWAADTDLALVKFFNLTEALGDNLSLNVAADNGFMVFINGQMIAKEMAEGFTSIWEYQLTTSNPLVQGMNVIEVLAEDHGGITYFDMELTGDTAPVPEPATMMLFGIGLLGLAGVSRRKK